MPTVLFTCDISDELAQKLHRRCGASYLQYLGEGIWKYDTERRCDAVNLIARTDAPFGSPLYDAGADLAAAISATQEIHSNGWFYHPVHLHHNGERVHVCDRIQHIRLGDQNGWGFEFEGETYTVTESLSAPDRIARHFNEISLKGGGWEDRQTDWSLFDDIV